MGSKSEKQAANAAYKAELRRLKLKARETKIEVKAAKDIAKIGRQDVKLASNISRVEAENSALLDPLATTAAVELSDTDARSAVIRAMPWLIGAVVVIGGIAYLRKRRTS